MSDSQSLATGAGLRAREALWFDGSSIDGDLSPLLRMPALARLIVQAAQSLLATGLPADLSISSSGLISGSLGYASAGTYSVTVTASDGTLSGTAAFSWTVGGTNRAPSADGQAVTTPEDTATPISLTGSDPDFDNLTYAVGTPAHGSLTGTAPGLTYTPAADYHGPDSFTFTVSDGTATSAPATVAITVTPVNDAPTVTNPGPRTGSVADAVDLQITATDIDGDPLTFSATGLPAGLTISSSGRITGTLTAAGTYPVTVTASDGTLSGTATFGWTVSTAPNTPPATPRNLTSRVTTVSVVLDWDNNTESDLAGYLVYRSASASGPWTKLTATSLTASAYTDTTAPAGATSYYRVTAIDTAGQESTGAATTSASRSLAFRASSFGQNGNATTLVIVKPAGVRAGDLLLAAITVAGTPSVTPPAGWTVIRTDASGSAFKQGTYFHVVDGTEGASFAWTFATPSAAAGGIAAYLGVETSGTPPRPVDASSGRTTTSSTTSILGSSITTLADGDLLVGVFGSSTNASFIPPAGMAEQVDIASSSGKSKIAISSPTNCSGPLARRGIEPRRPTRRQPSSVSSSRFDRRAVRPRRTLRSRPGPRTLSRRRPPRHRSTSPGPHRRTTCASTTT